LASILANFKVIKVRIQHLFIIVVLLFSGLAEAQEEGIYNIQTNTLLKDQTPPSLSFFENHSTLKIDIETNQNKLFSNLENPEKQKAVLTIYINDSIKIVKKIKIKVRGNTRKTICDLPPLKLDLNETEFLSDWLGEITSLKLVNTCSESAKASNYLHEEYIMYDMFQTLTDVSYQVRFLKLRLKDSKNEAEDIKGYAFVIENDKSLAARTGLTETELDQTSVGELLNTFYLDPREETLYNMNVLSIFQYMMGNTDWNIAGLHNIKIFGNEEVKFAVPYDFDYAGFVNANYAVPSSNVPVKSIRDRYYLGPCSDAIVFEKALDYVISKKDQLYQKIQYNPYLPNREKADLTAYLDSFFKETKDKKGLVNKLSSSRCQF
jgi:glutaredoxin-related protein